MEGRALPAAPRSVEPVATFAVVGPGKCGTTWMHEVLRATPGVVMAAVKETVFFDTHYDRGIDWYHALYPRTRPRGAPVGEVSNTYFAAPDAAARIAAYNPRMRLVTCVRDPVDRAHSHYLWLLRNGGERGSFEEVLDRRPDILLPGRYGEHLTRWLEHFPRDQVLVLSYDDLAAAPADVARRLLDFVGATAAPVPPVATATVLPASRARSKAAARVVKAAALAARRAGAPQVVGRMKRSLLPRLLYRPYEAAERPSIAPATRERLEQVFRDDLALLSELTGQDWSSRWSDEAA